MNFQLDFSEETKEVLERFLKEMKILNEHLADFKEIIAPYLGFKILKE